MEAHQEDVTEEGIHYVAMRNLFVRESSEAMEVKVEKKTRRMHIRESAELVELSKTVSPFSWRRRLSRESTAVTFILN